MIQVIDHFLDDYENVRRLVDQLEYEDTESPVDGVVYPGVSLDVPRSVQAEILMKLQDHHQCGITPSIVFLRLSLEGVQTPHEAHTDAVMGSHSLMLYLSRDEDIPDEAGTAFVRHIETGLEANPSTEEEQQVWEADTNNTHAWEIVEQCSMKANRACLFDAQRMHRAEPVHGFGSTPQDGRLVLTVFYALDDEN